MSRGFIGGFKDCFNREVSEFVYIVERDAFNSHNANSITTDVQISPMIVFCTMMIARKSKDNGSSTMQRIHLYFILSALFTPLLIACGGEPDPPPGQSAIMKSHQIQALKEAQDLSRDVEESTRVKEDRMKALDNQ